MPSRSENKTKPRIPRNDNDTKIENLMERFSNRLDLIERGISETNTRSTEIIQNAVQTGRKKMKQSFKGMDIVRKSKMLLTRVSEEKTE